MLLVNSSTNSGTPSVRSAIWEDDLVGQRLAAGDLCYQSGAVTPVQTVESQHADLRLAGPRRLELSAERHDQQHR
jgi:hypothetical protein